ncbi:hypothetical protein CSC65_01615 [Pseudoxanthomonas daejeonensis]|uniref:Uncharacterized protein n=1 Tax=Pseudoxanthomonas daejeonensis TaxID=266062 RepID=A0ABQ6ZC43_9GAMM|nr:hypothetical protein CSC65_01615 [Pseudoxanthomonas daejeonensis]
MVLAMTPTSNRGGISAGLLTCGVAFLVMALLGDDPSGFLGVGLALAGTAIASTGRCPRGAAP